MNIIRSRTHDSVKNIVTLQQTKERRAQGLFIAEGLRVISTLIASPIKLKQLYCLEDNATLLIEAENLCKKYHYNPQKSITLISKPVLEKISCLKTSSGILGVFYIPQAQRLDQLSHGVVLADIQSPGNMGTILRTAAALNMPSVVLIDGVDVWSPKVVQATAGTVGMLNLFECSWQELVHAKKDLNLCALVVNGGQTPQTVDGSQALFVVGNEAHGLPDAWITACNTKVTLPMPGNTESLNAAIALSIVMYVSVTNCKR